MKRFTSKEERRRVVAGLFQPEDVLTSTVGFENHLNVIHSKNRGLDLDTAKGVCLWLNSSVVDRYFRSFNGHTQVNATDLRRLPFPDGDELVAVGRAWDLSSEWSQEMIDGLLTSHIGAMHERAA